MPRTPELEQQYLHELNSLRTRPEYARWLLTKLGMLYDTTSTDAFEETKALDTWLAENRWRGLNEALASLYNQIKSPEQQQLFRQAIGDVIVHCGNQANTPLEKSTELLYLTVMVNAQESLPAFLPANTLALLTHYHSRLHNLSTEAQRAGGDEWEAFCTAVSRLTATIGGSDPDSSEFLHQMFPNAFTATAPRTRQRTTRPHR